MGDLAEEKMEEIIAVFKKNGYGLRQDTLVEIANIVKSYEREQSGRRTE